MTDLKPTEMTGKEMRIMRAGPDEVEQLTKQSQTQSAHSFGLPSIGSSSSLSGW